MSETAPTGRWPLRPCPQQQRWRSSHWINSVEVVERPLFHASRRPVPQEADDTPALAAAELRNLTLIGILISPETQLAIFQDKGTQALRLEAGATVGKWSLAEVRADGVTLRRGSETHVIALHKVESAHTSSSDGKSQATTAQVPDRDPAKIQAQKAPTREQRFWRKQGSS